MPRDYEVFLEDILEAIRKIAAYTQGMGLEDFRSDPKTIDAVVRNLEVVGEAVKNLPEDFRARYPEIEWRKLAGLRDILIHEYFGIDVDIIWDILQSKLPTLAEKISEILSG